MRTENSFAVARDGVLTRLGMGCLRFLNLKMEKPFAYPPGRLLKGDRLVLLCRDSGMLSGLVEDLSCHLGVSRRREPGGSLFLISAWDDAQTHPMYGPLFLPESGDIRCLETIFHGNDIRIRTQEDAGEVLIQINHQRLCVPFDQAGCAMVIFSDLGVKFFTPGHTAKAGDVLEARGNVNHTATMSDAFEVEAQSVATLRSRDFPAYIDLQSMRGNRCHISQVFSSSLSQACMELSMDHSRSFALARQGSRGVLLLLEDRTQEITFTLLDQGALLARMAEEADLYRSLVGEGEPQLRDASLHNGFSVLGSGADIDRIKRLLQKSCATNTTILLTGASGTGKTFLGRQIHENSRRHDRPFVHINCAAIPEQLIESELFGYEPGAFTGANREGKKGYFELANGGTLFFDEIGEIPMALQGKLLEAIQSKSFYRVGGVKKVRCDVRIIAATNRDLRKLVEKKQFREDLYYRINIFPIALPSLVQRETAMESIALSLLPDICANVGIEPLLLSPGAMQKLRSYHWPGNIRELENTLERAAILCDGKIIMEEDILFSGLLPSEECTPAKMSTGELSGTCISPAPAPMPLRERVAACERSAIVEALARFSRDKAKAASYLQISRTTLFEKMKKYEL